MLTTYQRFQTDPFIAFAFDMRQKCELVKPFRVKGNRSQTRQAHSSQEI